MSKKEGRVGILPVTKKYIFSEHINDSLVQFWFIDPFRLMASSVDKLALYLVDFPNLE